MKRTLYLFTAILLLNFSFANATISEKNTTKAEAPLSEGQQELELRQITRRVEEIKAMDKSHLNRQERKALRKELQEMKQQARALTGGGIYLSVGALLIIILVLILIL